MIAKFVSPLCLALALCACGSSSEPQQLPPSSFIKGINFVGVSVADIDRSTKLYSDSVALSVERESKFENSNFVDSLASQANVNATTRLLRSSNAQLLFMQFDSTSKAPAVPVNGPGIAHVCFQVDSKTQAYQRFLGGGAETIGAPELVQLNPRNPVHYAYANDPDGIMVEIEHVDVDKLELPEAPKNQYRVRHVSLGTPDMSRAIEFYSALLQQKKPRRIGRWWRLSGDKLDMISGLAESKIEMAWFQVRNLELEIVQYHSHPPQLAQQDRPLDALGYNMIVFEVDSLENARQQVAAAGGKLLDNTAILYGSEILFARDPDGNLLGFQASPKTSLISSQNFKDNGI